MSSASAFLVSNIGAKVYGSFCSAGQSEESIGQIQIIGVNHGRAESNTAISHSLHMGRESKPGGVLSLSPIHAALVEQLGHPVPISTTYCLVGRRVSSNLGMQIRICGCKPLQWRL